MASKKLEKLASLMASSGPDPPLPDPTARVKRNHSSITSLKMVQSAPPSDHSFDIIMRDPNIAPQRTTTSEKKIKSLDFLAPVKSLQRHHAAVPASSVGHVICGFRLKSQSMPLDNIQMCLENRELVKLVDLEEKIQTARRYWRANKFVVNNFVVIGIVCHSWSKSLAKDKSPCAPSSSAAAATSSAATPSGNINSSTRFGASSKSLDDESLLVVRLTDLSRLSVCLAVEPKLQSTLSLKFGDVLAVLNPTFEAALDGNGTLLKIQKESQLCVLGESADIGLCQYCSVPRSKNSATSSTRALLPPLAPSTSDRKSATTAGSELNRPGEPAVCPVFVNRSLTNYCEFHMFEMFSETKNQRMVLNDASGGALSKKAKHREFVETAKCLSDGVFEVCGSKWKVSERSVKVVSFNAHMSTPTVEQMYGDGPRLGNPDRGCFRQSTCVP